MGRVSPHVCYTVNVSLSRTQAFYCQTQSSRTSERILEATIQQGVPAQDDPRVSPPTPHPTTQRQPGTTNNRKSNPLTNGGLNDELQRNGGDGTVHTDILHSTRRGQREHTPGRWREGQGIYALLPASRQAQRFAGQPRGGRNTSAGR